MITNQYLRLFALHSLNEVIKLQELYSLTQGSQFKNTDELINSIICGFILTEADISRQLGLDVSLIIMFNNSGEEFTIPELRTLGLLRGSNDQTKIFNHFKSGVCHVKFEY